MAVALSYEKVGRHQRSGPFRQTIGRARSFAGPVAPNLERAAWRTTTVPPWYRKAARRSANKVARASRKANR